MADAVGANLVAQGKDHAMQLIKRSLRMKQMSRRVATGKGMPPVFTKHGVPATNTAADCPGQKYAWCWDSANKHSYLCTAYTNSTTFTWTRLDN